MNPGPGYFEIQVGDTTRAIRFYSEVFGWKFSEVKELPIEYWQIQTASLPGGLLKPPVSRPPQEYGTNAYVCSIEVPNFDATAEKILSLSGIVAMAKFPIPGKCWQRYFLDTEGNTFGIFQVDEKAGL
jgi:predicted enzyme related to lactoylglutathione lyase